MLKVFFVFMRMISVISAYNKHFEGDLNANENSVEVRAVFINCDMDEEHFPHGSESFRFQREELFKHNAIRDCKRKLAVTLKMTSYSSHSSSDEYIPIEHVFDGSSKKRVRLLNPYILRLRREPPYEAYKLQEIDTFSGLLTTSNEMVHQTHRRAETNRIRRNIHITDKEYKDTQDRKPPCLATNALFNRSLEWIREKRFIFDTNIPNDPYKESVRPTSPYLADHYEFNNNPPPNINLDNNVTESIRQEPLDNLDGTERIFQLYEIGDPNIWFKTQVQLLEKLSTPEGKTIWNDLTKQESVRISSLHPEWKNQDVDIRYRCAEPISKEDFSLPSTGTCLLLPLNGKLNDGFNNDKWADFIIVPIEDIEAIDERSGLKTTQSNSSTNSASGTKGDQHRRILVRLSRALFGRKENNFIINSEQSGKYLRIPYRQLHHAQIELEAKADENQLVYVGSSGRLTTAVSESTRGTRAVLTVQATNTGLAAALLRPMVRECNPEPLRFNEDDIEIAVKPVLIPPMHTHKFCFDIPLEMPGDISHCSVALLNDADESIAVRDVRIKRNDRCFCVWHCQCVCLNEDPKLLCQEMSEFQQNAAGLSPRAKLRQVRATCHPDVVTVNLLSVVFGVLFLLLFLGLLKALLGLFLRCVGSWGIALLLQTPRKLDRYYERSLRSRQVVYDEDGWPVHPDTMKRTVRLISKPMEFMLNIAFFIITPCLLLWNPIKQIASRCLNKENSGGCDPKPKKCSSAYGMQGKETRLLWRRRNSRLSRWMSPHAEQLTSDIWHNSLASGAPQGCCFPECMRPLLCDDRFTRNKLRKLHSPAVDSEQDDTEYVLMEMQISRETLSKNLQKFKPTSSAMD